MKAENLTFVKVRHNDKTEITCFNNSKWMLQPKWDGMRAQMIIGENGNQFFTKGQKLKGMPGHIVAGKTDFSHLVPHLSTKKFDNIPVGTILDGEVIGTSFKETVSFCKRGTAQEGSDIISFIAFDIVQLGDEDLKELSFKDRFEKLSSLCLPIAVSPTPQTLSEDRLFEAFTDNSCDKLDYENYLKSGFEGIILRDVAAKYGKGVLKLKPKPNVDSVVFGFKAGEKGYGAYLGDPISKEEIETLLTSQRKGGENTPDGLISLKQDCPTGMIGALITAQWKSEEDPIEEKDLIVDEKEIDGKKMKLIYVAGASGFDLNYRTEVTKKFWNLKDSLVFNNKLKCWILPKDQFYVVEMQVQELSEYGHYRFPQILRDRQDKNSEDCIYADQAEAV